MRIKMVGTTPKGRTLVIFKKKKKKKSKFDGTIVGLIIMMYEVTDSKQRDLSKGKVIKKRE